MRCPQYFNPVYSQDGKFYPSLCWAEIFGAKDVTFGYSPVLIKLFSDQWKKEGFEVPSPNIEFTYQGSGIVGAKIGMWLRSTFWSDINKYFFMDYDIATTFDGVNFNNIGFIRPNSESTLFPVINQRSKVLMAFVMFDNAYPEQELVSFTDTYGALLNNYFRQKQKVSSPNQYNFFPVVIPPPAGVQRPATDHRYFSHVENQAIFNAATAKIGNSDFNTFAIIPVTIRGFGGYYTIWNDMQLIMAALFPYRPYSTANVMDGLNAISFFQGMFLTLSHEVLHAVGLHGDHMPMGYGTTFLDASVGALETDPLSGKKMTPKETVCDFLADAPGYYTLELPKALQVTIGSEPQGLVKEKSLSGDCLAGLEGNRRLKDIDKDGVYEMVDHFNLIGVELQRTLGWIDVDGDGIAELVDSTPYGKK